MPSYLPYYSIYRTLTHPLSLACGLTDFWVVRLGNFPANRDTRRARIRITAFPEVDEGGDEDGDPNQFVFLACHREMEASSSRIPLVLQVLI
jgi:hypothetical protein